MRIAVIGSGYVGLVAAACFAEIGHVVTCVDNDTEKLVALEGGATPIHEKFLPELLARHRGKGLGFSGSLRDSVLASQAVFIAVGTPAAETGEADLSYVESVSREIAQAIQSAGGDYKIVVEKSTVPVYTSHWIRRVMELNGTPAAAFDVASNPEFLREGTAVTDFLYPDRIVVGADTERCVAMLREIYRPLTSGSYSKTKDAVPEPDGARIPAPLIATSAKSAELIKHASNAFLATKISFINAVANVCEAVGADVEQVREGMGADSRIGRRFLNPGVGYGGSCFPKDLTAFRAVARDCGYEFGLLDEVIHINEEQRQRFMRKVRGALWTLKGKKLAALGLAFKGGTDDLRESPAIAVIQTLLKEGCEVVAYDPAAMEKTRAARQALFSDFSQNISFAESAYQAAEGADALLILTDWEEFAALDLERLRATMNYGIMVDGRNLFKPEQVAAFGFIYISVGRPDVFPQKPVAIKAPKTQ
jgi:UDPglucose 6-dehydrogenase